MKQEWNKKILLVLALAILFFMGGVAFYWFSQHNHHSMGSQNKSQHHAQHLKHHEPDEHDEVNMPGLKEKILPIRRSPISSSSFKNTTKSAV